MVKVLLDEMLGLGPLEPLLADESINDIMVNGFNQVYIERRGKLVLTDVKFRDDRHVMNVATRIVSQIGRRVDRWSMRASKTAAASISSSRRWPLTDLRSPFVSSPRKRSRST